MSVEKKEPIFDSLLLQELNERMELKLEKNQYQAFGKHDYFKPVLQTFFGIPCCWCVFANGNGFIMPCSNCYYGNYEEPIPIRRKIESLLVITESKEQNNQLVETANQLIYPFEYDEEMESTIIKENKIGTFVKPTVYFIKCTSKTGKTIIYVGKTDRSFEDRWKEHCKGWKGAKTKGYKQLELVMLVYISNCSNSQGLEHFFKKASNRKFYQKMFLYSTNSSNSSFSKKVFLSSAFFERFNTFLKEKKWQICFFIMNEGKNKQWSYHR